MYNIGIFGGIIIRPYRDENFLKEYAYCYHCGKEHRHHWYRLENNKNKYLNTCEHWRIEDQYYFVKLTRSEKESRLNDFFLLDNELCISVCEGCGVELPWQSEQNIHAPVTLIAPPDRNVPVESKLNYNEARKIYKSSSRGAATLLRIAIESLLVHLNLGLSSADLSSMVKELSEKKKANLIDCPEHIINGLLRTCLSEKGKYSAREMRGKENSEDVQILFQLVNEITEEFINRGRRIELFNAILKK
ncbi:DUF4145 domain-containing protein [Lysinibacillus sp. CD3-6]|uniref:hypothetical protein n=1 Tax=Lysinibacillus sp. CD3-6 TaxID=2892541 RepID=UPI001120FCCA|nr:hypothetical protein [Lysinibacillus sp. CD3-6]UED79612.1 DUF4145 domain-containing protein [Lysinibacillus sp. CD3-6]